MQIRQAGELRCPCSQLQGVIMRGDMAMVVGNLELWERCGGGEPYVFPTYISLRMEKTSVGKVAL